uniref:Aspartate racemase n=1 Tax=Candidatus Kentrum sp. DK TaxID=2126562 RepID=A0A450SMG6_9GAMM|nr:MAG: aspartate racemase [Candidatus Kentron sp. DK]
MNTSVDRAPSEGRPPQKYFPGIIGGMGPLAHTTFEQILIEQSMKRGGRRDQDHPLWLLLNAADVPDRTDCLLGKAEGCISRLIAHGRFLESAGVDFLVIPCNTAHAFYEEVRLHLGIPWIHLIDCATQFLLENHPGIRKIGILATNGTLRAGLYPASLTEAGLTPVSLEPDSKLQRLLMDTIYDLGWGIKATGSQISPSAQENLEAAVEHLAKQGAEIVIAGCSELSVGFYETDTLALPWIDPLEIMANITLDLAFGRRSLPVARPSTKRQKCAKVDNSMKQPAIVSRTREYYNSDEVLSFQRLIYDNSDHCSIGLYDGNESIHDAMRHTVEKMASRLALDASGVVLDLGAGYGGAARHLARTAGCFVDCLNLGEGQNRRNRELNKEQRLESQIRVMEGSFEEIPAEEGSYDVAWSQDALLFSSDHRKVFREVHRVLKKGGHFIFTDPMKSDDCPDEVLGPILARIHLDSLSSFSLYRNSARTIGFEEVEMIPLPGQLTEHYRRLLEKMDAHHEDFVAACGGDYTGHQHRGLAHWVAAGEKGYLDWGILHFRKPGFGKTP